jgi:membrane-bound metal-dependent hydrolase YbcI (DUF457 family)
MDPITHGLASVAVARAFFPRASRQTLIASVVAGTLPDIGGLSTFLGPDPYFTWHQIYAQWLLVPILTPAIIVSIFVVATSLWGGVVIPLGKRSQNGEAAPEDARATQKLVLRTFLSATFAAPFFAVLFHVAMDACQSEGVALFWPFSSRRIAADWLPGLDPWILAILILGVALPELLRLVSDEIGAKDKRPRGRTGAIIGLALVLLYVGVRATLHSNVLAMMQARTYRGESPRRAGAFPESASVFTWHGIVETDRALHEFTVDAFAGALFDPESGVALFKPEPSPALDKARDSGAARRFLNVARFPKATVEKTADGYEVELRDLRYAAAGETRHEIAVLVKIDSNGKVADEALVWARDLHRR